MSQVNLSTKQQMLDKTPSNNEEQALQNILITMSKTRIEQVRRVMNEINNTVLYKTQLRSLSFISVLNQINIATAMIQEEENMKK